MPVMQEPNNLGDLLKYEAPNLYSREDVDVEGNIKLGTIVGKVKETGIVKELNLKATDGSQHVFGVMIGAEDKKGVAIVRHAIVADHVLIWPKDLSDAQRKTVIAQLYNLGIVIRKGA